MGFVFSELGRRRAFSDVVRQAMSLGYTEPDPRDDLSGIDVARKGLILSRMLGYAGEMQDVEIESLIPDMLRDVSRDDFLAALPESDAAWAAAVDDARANATVLRYRVRVTRGGWEELDDQTTDTVFAAHVVYAVPHIKDFLSRLQRAATAWCAVIVFADPPQSRLFGFWQAIFGERRLPNPCLPQLLDVGAGAFAGDPAAIVVRRRNLAVKRDRGLERD